MWGAVWGEGSGRGLQEVVGGGVLRGLGLLRRRGGDGQGRRPRLCSFVRGGRGAFLVLFTVSVHLSWSLAGGDTANTILAWLSRRTSCPLLCNLIYPDVHQDHDEAWGKEGADGGVKYVPTLFIESTLRTPVKAFFLFLTFVQ